MKKLLTLLLMVGIVFLFTGCGDDDDDTYTFSMGAADKIWKSYTVKVYKWDGHTWTQLVTTTVDNKEKVRITIPTISDDDFLKVEVSSTEGKMEAVVKRSELVKWGSKLAVTPFTHMVAAKAESDPTNNYEAAKKKVIKLLAEVKKKLGKDFNVITTTDEEEIVNQVFAELADKIEDAPAKINEFLEDVLDITNEDALSEDKVKIHIFEVLGETTVASETELKKKIEEKLKKVGISPDVISAIKSDLKLDEKIKEAFAVTEAAVSQEMNQEFKVGASNLNAIFAAGIYKLDDDNNGFDANAGADYANASLTVESDKLVGELKGPGTGYEEWLGFGHLDNRLWVNGSNDVGTLADDNNADKKYYAYEGNHSSNYEKITNLCRDVKEDIYKLTVNIPFVAANVTTIEVDLALKLDMKFALDNQGVPSNFETGTLYATIEGLKLKRISDDEWKVASNTVKKVTVKGPGEATSTSANDVDLGDAFAFTGNVLQLHLRELLDRLHSDSDLAEHIKINYKGDPDDWTWLKSTDDPGNGPSGLAVDKNDYIQYTLSLAITSADELTFEKNVSVVAASSSSQVSLIRTNDVEWPIQISVKYRDLDEYQNLYWVMLDDDAGTAASEKPFAFSHDVTGSGTTATINDNGTGGDENSNSMVIKVVQDNSSNTTTGQDKLTNEYLVKIPFLVNSDAINVSFIVGIEEEITPDGTNFGGQGGTLKYWILFKNLKIEKGASNNYKITGCDDIRMAYFRQVDTDGNGSYDSDSTTDIENGGTLLKGTTKYLTIDTANGKVVDDGGNLDILTVENTDDYIILDVANLLKALADNTNVKIYRMNSSYNGLEEVPIDEFANSYNTYDGSKGYLNIDLSAAITFLDVADAGTGEKIGAFYLSGSSYDTASVVGIEADVSDTWINDIVTASDGLNSKISTNTSRSLKVTLEAKGF